MTMPVVETERLLLRGFSSADFRRFAATRADLNYFDRRREDHVPIHSPNLLRQTPGNG